MDNMLSAFLPKDEAEIMEVWGNANFVLDTNVLLNLYKYSNSTREEILTILDLVNGRLWLPHQVAIEFIHNRNTKINEQKEEYKDQLNSIENAKIAAMKEIKSKVDGIRKPFRKLDIDTIRSNIDNFFDELKEDYIDQNKNQPDFEKEDIILDKFYQLFDTNIGNPYTQEELNELYKEGEVRYKRMQPPGYEDLKNKKGQYKMFGDTLLKGEYGDFILWKQIIDNAKASNIDIIFITEDKKPDWWREISGKTIGPRTELINEFTFETNRTFLMYTTEVFLKHSKDVFNYNVTDETLEEVHFVNTANSSKFDEKKSVIIGSGKYINKNIALLRQEIKLGQSKLHIEMEILSNLQKDLNFFNINKEEEEEDSPLILYFATKTNEQMVEVDRLQKLQQERYLKLTDYEYALDYDMHNE